MPRMGSGVMYGASVSVSRRSAGTRAAASRVSSAFLNVSAPPKAT